MKWIQDKELRSYVGSWFYIGLVFTIIAFLSYKEVPHDNNDIIKTIIGMLIGSLTIVVYTLIGKDPEEVKQAEEKAERLEQHLLIEQEKYKDSLNKVRENAEIRVDMYKQETAQIRQELAEVKKMFMDLQKNVIDKLSMLKENEKR